MMLRAIYAPPEIKGATRLVLIALADHANDEDGECYPSVKRLAYKAAVTERQARRSVEWLEERGYAIRIGRRGNRTNVYRLALPDWKYPLDRTRKSGLANADRTQESMRPDMGVRTDRTRGSAQTGHGSPPIPKGTRRESPKNQGKDFQSSESRAAFDYWRGSID